MSQGSPARVLKPRSGRGKKIQAWDDFVGTGPGTLMGKLLRKYWQPVAVSSSLPATGQQ